MATPIDAKASCDVNKTEQKGKFDWFPEPHNSFYLIEDAYNAIITIEGAPEFFENKSLDTSFMFTHQNGPMWDEIHKKMDYEGHSGYSYAWTMRNIEHIFKFGWDNWVYTVKKNYVETN